MRYLILLLIVVLSTFYVTGISNSFAVENEWSTESPMPTIRTEHTAAIIDDKIYVIGGFDHNGDVIDRVEVYNINEDKWTEVEPMPVALHHASATSFNIKLYVIGGFIDGWNPISRMYIYDTQEDSWTEGEPMPTARGALTTQRYNNYIFAIGGMTSFGPTTINEMYDIEKK